MSAQRTKLTPVVVVSASEPLLTRFLDLRVCADWRVSRRPADVWENTAAVVVEARNLIDRYEFVEHARKGAYPRGLDPPGSGTKATRSRRR